MADRKIKLVTPTCVADKALAPIQTAVKLKNATSSRHRPSRGRTTIQVITAAPKKGMLIAKFP
jgi:hypothetical protein